MKLFEYATYIDRQWVTIFVCAESEEDAVHFIKDDLKNRGRCEKKEVNEMLNISHSADETYDVGEVVYVYKDL
ncbi:hypothetical protein KY334_02515 [Candidatus Woesearchaeota archaeon]|nr:hypothetical protein [Candidatus Woesearchaeota archaeon]